MTTFVHGSDPVTRCPCGEIASTGGHPFTPLTKPPTCGDCYRSGRYFTTEVQ